MNSALKQYLKSLSPEMEALTPRRQQLLQQIASYIKARKQAQVAAQLTFICTHNSRRSHMSQIWAATAASYYGVAENLHTYSGGTEATAFNPRAVAAMERAGFAIQGGHGANPRYEVTFSESEPSLHCFSKKYDDPYNPQENFAAIMTCSEADENCPFIPGAALRVTLPYVDPKEADGTEREKTAYDERCRQIAAEMFYLMKLVKAS